MKIIFIGTPEFGAIILENLIKASYKPVLVVTSPDKPAGRKKVLTPSPVKIISQKHKILVEQPEQIKNLKLKAAESLVHLSSRSALPNSAIENLKPDLIVVAAYGQILPKEILEIPKYGCLNIHPSLLPKYRGPAPVQTAILNGEKETGVSIIKMTERVDAGPIIASKKLKAQNEKLAYKELHNQLAELGSELLVETISAWVKGKIKPRKQDESKATYTEILKKEDGKIDWQKTAQALERQIRAFHPWPGAYAFWQSIKVKITKADVYKKKSGPQLPELPKEAKGPRRDLSLRLPFGKVLVLPQNKIGVQCKKDFLVIEKLQLEGKKEMPIEDFLRGHSKFIGAVLD